MSEADFASRVLAILHPHFHIYQEVSGCHFTGRLMRIDAVVVPREKHLWKNPSIALGIEFKGDGSHLGDNQRYAGWMAQCIDYAHTCWDDFDYIHVFSCPGFFETLYGTGESEMYANWLLSRMMTQMGVGELRFDRYSGLTFYLQETHRIWSQRYGISGGKHWNLKRRFGSRG